MTLPLMDSDARKRFRVGQTVRLTRAGQYRLNGFHRFVLTQGLVVGFCRDKQLVRVRPVGNKQATSFWQGFWLPLEAKT